VLTRWWRWPTRRGVGGGDRGRVQVGADRGDGGRTRDVHEVTGPGTMVPMLQASTWEPTAPLMAQLPAPA